MAPLWRFGRLRMGLYVRAKRIDLNAFLLNKSGYVHTQFWALRPLTVLDSWLST